MRTSKHALAQVFVSQEKLATGALDAAAKPSNWEHFGQVAGKALQLGGLALPVIGMTAQLGAAVYDKMTAATRKADAYKSMLEQNPHLQTHDQTTVQKYFNSLYHMDPHMASDPTIAASFVNNLVLSSDPSRGPMMAHRDVFDTSLKARGRQGPQGHGVGQMTMDIGKSLGDVAMHMRDTAAERKLQDFMGRRERELSQHEAFQNKAREMAAAALEKQRAAEESEYKTRRMHGFGKAREKGLRRDLGEAQGRIQRGDEYVQYLEDQLKQKNSP